MMYRDNGHVGCFSSVQIRVDILSICQCVNEYMVVIDMKLHCVPLICEAMRYGFQVLQFYEVLTLSDINSEQVLSRNGLLTR